MTQSKEKKLTIENNFEKNLRQKIANRIKRQMESKFENPMIKASYHWSILSEQLRDILGVEIYNQWFKNVKPVVVSNETLLLEAQTKTATQWITTHYQELVDALLSVQDKNMTSFFISSQSQQMNLKGSTSKIYGHSKKDYSDQQSNNSN
jgi:hypothetical protein